MLDWQKALGLTSRRMMNNYYLGDSKSNQWKILDDISGQRKLNLKINQSHFYNLRKLLDLAGEMAGWVL